MKQLYITGRQFGKVTLTYCCELLTSLIRDAGQNIKDLHYTVNGVEGTLTDSLDGQEYIITLKPKKGNK